MSIASQLYIDWSLFYPAWGQPKPATPAPVYDLAKYPHKCPCCGKPAYIGIVPSSKPDCAANCEGSKIWPLKV